MHTKDNNFSRKCRKLSTFVSFSLEKPLFIIIFFCLGNTLGLIGPTLLQLEKLTDSRDDEISLIFTARAVGSIAGWILSILLLEFNSFKESTCFINVGLFSLFAVNCIIPWTEHLWFMMAVFALQGAFMSITIQGSVSYHRSNSQKCSHVIPVRLTIACLLGCVFAPFYILLIERGVESNSLSLGKQMNGITLNTGFKNANILHFNHSHPITTLKLRDEKPSKNLENRVKRSAQNDRSNTLNGKVLHQSNHFNFSGNSSWFISQQKNDTIFKFHGAISNNSSQSKLPKFTNESTVSISSNSKSINSRITSPSDVTSLSPSFHPKKPLINDAKHLNQNLSSADGSQAASKMKQLVKVQRIEEVLNNPTNQQSLAVDSNLVKIPESKIAVNTSKIQLTSNVTNSTHISLKLNDTVDSNISHTIQIAKTENGFKPVRENYEDSFQPGNHTTKISENKTQFNFLTFTEGSALLRKPNVIVSLHEHPNNQNFVTDKNNLTLSSKISINISKSALNNAKNLTLLLNDSLKIPQNSSVVREHITEHSNNKNHMFNLPFQRVVSPIHKIYLLLGFLALILWFLTLPMTHWFISIFHFCYPTNSTTEDLQLVTIRNSSERNINTSESIVRQRLLDSSGDSDSDVIFDLHSSKISETKSEESIYHTVLESSIHSDSEVNKTIRSEKFVEECQSSNSHIKPQENCLPNEVSNSFIRNEIANSLLSYINIPSNIWLLFATFVNSGLETSYGAFVHGYTLRYLLWTPRMALFVTSLFWLGDLSGRLIRSIFISAKSPDVLENNHQSLKNRVSSRRRFSRSNSVPSKVSVEWVFSVIQLCGCFVCMISAVALTRLSLSTGRWGYISTTPLSRSYLTWLGGSFFFGLGIGLSAAYGGTMITSYVNFFEVDQSAHYIQLADYLGQLFVPSFIGYIHHQALFWKYSCLLSEAILSLSLLMSFLIIFHIITAIRLHKRMITSSKSTDIFRFLTQLSSKNYRYKRFNQVIHHGDSNPSVRTKQ